MWYWRRMEISWTDRVKIEEMLHRAKDERNILRRNCPLKHVIEIKIKGKI
jgi:hypothetical protein